MTGQDDIGARRSSGEDRVRFERATADLDPPFAIIDLEALWANAADMRNRASGKPIRLASKSVRCRSLQREIVGSDGFRGTLAFTLAEALWLASHGFDDLLVAYPTADRGSLRELTALLTARPETKLTLMVDSLEQLDLIRRVVGTMPQPLRVCLDVDAGWWVLSGRVRVGAKRSPVHAPQQAASLARAVVARGFRLVGVMLYESQIAGVGDAVPGRPLRSRAIRAMQSLSAAELADRRAQVVSAVTVVQDLEFVNGGGTGSLDETSADAVISELGAGSGLFAPALFSTYSSFTPRPAAFFALPVVRRPTHGVVTVLGGGYLASGPGDRARLPQPHLPPGLSLDRNEGAGEVQTPLKGPAADTLAIGDRVYFRHAKAGEMCERFDRLYLIDGDEIRDEVPTYRGEGRCFL